MSLEVAIRIVKSYEQARKEMSEFDESLPNAKELMFNIAESKDLHLGICNKFWHIKKQYPSGKVCDYFYPQNKDGYLLPETPTTSQSNQKKLWIEAFDVRIKVLNQYIEDQRKIEMNFIPEIPYGPELPFPEQ